MSDTDADTIIWLHAPRLARELGLPKNEAAISSHRHWARVSKAMADVGVTAEEAVWNMQFNYHVIFGR